MKELYSVIKAPLITEKATLQKEMANQLVFKVDQKANKIEIKTAVEKIFKVKVTVYIYFYNSSNRQTRHCLTTQGTRCPILSIRPTLKW